jgi:hypothetical protein
LEAIMTERSGGKGCFKFGCFGCLGAVALLIGLPALLALVGYLMGSPNPDYETVERSRPLPALSVSQPDRISQPDSPGLLEDPETAAGVAAPGAAGTITDVAGSGPRSLDLEPDLESPVALGRVLLDLSMGEFTVVPGPAAEGIRVEADYDRASFDLEEHYEQEEDGTWTYELRLKNRVSWMRRIWGNEDIKNQVRVILPRGFPMALEGKFGMGKSDLELGGLWLSQVDLDLSTGEHDVAFSEPTLKPLERLQVDARWGEVDLLSIGNASPAETEIQGKGGEFGVNLQGAWRTDGHVAVEFQFGECNVRLPEDVQVVYQRAKVGLGEKNLRRPEPDGIAAGAPTLYLDLRGSFGELNAGP